MIMLPVIYLTVEGSKLPGSDGNFSCFACSYVHPKMNGMDCVNNTNYLKMLPSYSVKCGNYCVTSEVLDKSKYLLSMATRTSGKECTYKSVHGLSYYRLHSF